jgi:hypothetical protein
VAQPADRRPGAAVLIDCPNGDFWRGFWLKYRITKDLACLDKVAKYHLSPPSACASTCNTADVIG